MNIPAGSILIARVLNEDKDFMILEVAKDENVTFHLDENPESNRFFSLIFLKAEPDGSATVLKPPWT